MEDALVVWAIHLPFVRSALLGIWWAVVDYVGTYYREQPVPA